MDAALRRTRVLVTGASAGIGRAVVLALAGTGAAVVATARRRSALDALRSECGDLPGKVETIAGDLNDPDFCHDLGAAAGQIDIFVNNAGVLKYAPILDMTDEDCDAMFRTNVLAAFRVTRIIARAMVERRRGHIIIMSSTAARDVYPLGAVYCATKHALSAMARGLRIELQAQGIKVTEIAPGMVDTAIRSGSDHPRVLEALKVRKFAPLTPEEVAAAVLFAAQAPPNCCPDLIELRPQGAA